MAVTSLQGSFPNANMTMTSYIAVFYCVVTVCPSQEYVHELQLKYNSYNLIAVLSIMYKKDDKLFFNCVLTFGQARVMIHVICCKQTNFTARAASLY